MRPTSAADAPTRRCGSWSGWGDGWGRGGTTLSTEDNFSGKGESVGKGVKTSTATTVEEANAADEEPSTKFQINTDRYIWLLMVKDSCK